MSTGNSEQVPSELIKRVSARLAERASMSKGIGQPGREYGGFHEAAAMAGWFDPQTIRANPAATGRDTVDELLAHSVETVDSDGVPRWTLAPEIRIAVLGQLRQRGRVQETLDASGELPGDLLHESIAAHLTHTAKPIGEQSIAELGTTYEVCEWLRSAGFKGIPERDAITRRTDWLTFLQPFEHIAGEHFRDRTRELGKLRSYAEVAPPGSVISSTRRLIKKVLSLNEKPPLLVYGPGGVGKSALIARFILEHAQALEVDRFPFVYLDFDRPDIDASEPLTLLIEALRQIGIGYPQARDSCEHIQQNWLDLLPSEGVRSTRSAAVRDFGTIIASLGADDRPVLFVLDTFEEVQYRSEEYVAAIWRMLEELQPAVSRLRVCIAGRGELSGHKTDGLALAGFDEVTAIEYLNDRGVAGPDAARKIFQQVGGSPLSLSLAAEVAGQEGLTSGRLDITTREFMFVRVEDKVVQRQLYRRILEHIHSESVKRLAHPGLVLRRLTPELIMEVLAEPCGLRIDSLADARALFEELRREVSLVTVAGDGALLHRQDLRVLMLDLLEREEPDKTRWIRSRAVSYYERRPALPSERAEEIYHRLALGQASEVINERWIPGVEPYLATVLSEFHGARRAYFASRLGVEVDEETQQLADLEDWERVVERKARDLLAEQRPQEALSLMASREERSPASPLFGLQATALALLGQWPESLATLDKAIDLALADQDRHQALRLSLQRVEIQLVSVPADGAERVGVILEQLSDGSSPRYRLDALAHLLALWRVVTPPSAGEMADLQRELRELFDATPDDILENNPTLAYWVASLFGREDLARLSRVLRVCGLPRTDDSAVREIAAEIASFDLELSTNGGAAPGVLARGLGVSIADSLTVSWGSFLLTANDAAVRYALCRLLDEHSRSVPARLTDAFASLIRSALGIERLTSTGPVESPVGPSPLRGPASLTEPVRNDLKAALLSAFPSQDALRGFVRRLGLSLDAIAFTPVPAAAAAAVINYAEEHGLIEQLVASAREADPANAALIRMSAELGLSTIVPGHAASIERVVAARTSIAPTVWRDRLTAIEGQVCRVEIGNQTFCTGYLVGIDLVLTANHMLRSTSGGEVSPRDVHLRFDYKTDRRGSTVTAGTVLAIDEVVTRSEYAPGADGLGYALLHVPGSPGVQPIGGGRAGPRHALRRWIEIPEPPPQLLTGAGMAMVHHPLGEPLKLALSAYAVAGFSDDGARVYYDLASEPGSSGSPCFTYDLELVAFHVGRSLADPKAPRKAGVGVLMSAVLRDLEARGFGGLLGRFLP
jgi:hypothetical protein